ncbi:MAG: TVP38/TMEM64 family protein [Chloroflexota bacterium]
MSTSTLTKLATQPHTKWQQITTEGNQKIHALSAALSRHRQKLAVLTFWAILVATYLSYTSANGLTPLAALRQILNLTQNSDFGPLLFITIFTIRPLIFFSAVLLTIVGGFLFGPFWGALYAILGSNASALAAYVIGRYFGAGFIKTDDNRNGIMQRYAKRMHENSFETVLIMRFVFLPFDLVNYLGGLLRLDWKAFLLATAIGSVPGILSFTLFGASIDSLDGGLPNVDWTTLIAGIFLLMISLLVSRYVKNRER